MGRNSFLPRLRTGFRFAGRPGQLPALYRSLSFTAASRNTLHRLVRRSQFVPTTALRCHGISWGSHILAFGNRGLASLESTASSSGSSKSSQVLRFGRIFLAIFGGAAGLLLLGSEQKRNDVKLLLNDAQLEMMAGKRFIQAAYAALYIVLGRICLLFFALNITITPTN